MRRRTDILRIFVLWQEEEIHRQKHALNKREEELTSVHASRQHELEEAQRVAKEARAALKREKAIVQRRLNELEEQTVVGQKALVEREQVLRKETAQTAERQAGSRMLPKSEAFIPYMYM